MRLFRNPKGTQYAILVFITLLLLAFATNCRAAELEFGAGKTYIRGDTEVIDLSLTLPLEGLEAAWQTSLTLVGSSRYDGLDQPNNFAVQSLLVDGFGNFDVGFGVGFLQNSDRYNGSSMNFVLQLGLDLGRVKVTARHWSNAGTRKPNLGRDFLLISYSF